MHIPHWKHAKILFASSILDNSLIKSLSKSELLMVFCILFSEIVHHLTEKIITQIKQLKTNHITSFFSVLQVILKEIKIFKCNDRFRQLKHKKISDHRNLYLQNYRFQKFCLNNAIEKDQDRQIRLRSEVKISNSDKKYVIYYHFS